MDRPELNDDFKDLLEVLLDSEVDFLIVGAHAMAAHGVARATGDIDIFVRASAENAQRVMEALHRFGAPVSMHGITEDDFAQVGWIYQMGRPPRRIDILTSISGVRFEDVWQDRLTVQIDTLDLPFLGLSALRANKLAAGRPKDLADLLLLNKLP